MKTLKNSHYSLNCGVNKDAKPRTTETEHYPAEKQKFQIKRKASD